MDSLNTLYPAVKHTHMLLIAVSVLLFITRFSMSLAKSNLLQKKLFKIAPHAIDTLLLLSGLTLCFLIHQYPFVDPWLTEKVLALVAYILLGVMAMKSDRNKLFRIFAFVGALGWIVLAAKLAVVKQAVIMS